VLDIQRIAQAALSQARTLLPAWLPGGKWDGQEWRCGDLSGAPGKSFGCNAKSGRWSDFASGESGGDLVSLYAAIHGVGQGEAARAVAGEVGVETDSVVGGSHGQQQRPKEGRHGRPTAGAVESRRGGEERKTEWRPVVPVPDDAAPLPLAHPVRGAYQSIWRYHDRQCNLLGAVCRFTTSDGGKEILPLVWCEHPKKRPEWRWLQWDEPRPLYLPKVWPDGDTQRPVLVVEGEKCALAATEVLFPWCHVVSWPGGGKAVHKADWSWIAGRRVILWPDADAKRDKSTGELLPPERQPGIATMRKLAGILAVHGCKVRVVDIPAPGEKPDGWDVYDAIEEGGDFDSIKAWILDRLIEPPAASSSASPPEPPRAPPPPGGSDYPPDSGANWDHVLITGRSGPIDCRENVLLVLSHHPVWKDAIGFNAFASRTESRRRTPWGTGPGEWTTRDDRELGLWLAQGCDLLIKSEANLSAGVEMYAERNTFHPVLAYLDSLEWDGTDRLSFWLTDCLGVSDTTYSRLAGAMFLRSMVARVWKPGAQVDHMLVLEGGQGAGKSSAFRVLGGEWFSDTQFRLGDKDALLQLEDVWLYEVSELDAFSKADVTAVKQFLTTLNDKFRGVYERRSRRRPRQVVMGGSTNQDRYLRDSTGNRRFWPVTVGTIRLDLLRAVRDQLFAQAYAEIKAGERWWPTREEERAYFIPAQDSRVIVDPWSDELQKRLAEAKYGDRVAFTTSELLAVLGVASDKIDGGGQMARRIQQIMHALGWTMGRQRRPDGTRPRVYIRKGSESSVDQGEDLDRVDQPGQPIEVPL
jgi:putative DNA primase/helicase